MLKERAGQASTLDVLAAVRRLSIAAFGAESGTEVHSQLAHAGHFDVEIVLGELRAAAGAGPEHVLPLVQQYEIEGRKLNLLAGGRVVNLAAGEGHPAAVMDMSFATQALAVEHLVSSGDTLEPRVLDVPNAIDAEIARLKLAALDVEIDELTEDQRSYLHSWTSD